MHMSENTYDLDTSIRHITMESQMDYAIHRWACEQWGHPPTATAFALITSDTLGEAKQAMEGDINDSERAPLWTTCDRCNSDQHYLEDCDA